MGIDGCRAGWVIAGSDSEMTSINYSVVETGAIGQVFADAAAEERVVAIDIPIGLAESTPRACDLAARRYLRQPRSSSVFPAPCRATLPATTYREACELNRCACGRAISLQAFGILPKMRFTDVVMTPERQHHIRETHPEVVFARLSCRGIGLLEPKKSVQGREIRRKLLEKRLPPIDVDAIRRRLGRSKVAVDDLLDALACLVAAQNVSTGNPMVLPGGNLPEDRRGLRMEIVA